MRYLFVPGAGGQGWIFHRVVPLLDDAVAPDLPAADETAGLHDYVDVLVDAAGEPPPDGYVVVAQSMGALTGPLLCDRLDVRHLVLLNPMIAKPGETGGEWWEATDQAAAMIGPFDERETFFHDVPPEITAEAFAADPVDQSGTPFEEPWPLTRWPDVPTRVVVGADDRLFPVEFQRRVAKERLGIEVDVVPGGHLNALSRPAELAAYLRAL
ncbi:alpha/beta hydrolase [Nocardioides sp. TF02-7]|uniref:alpha/beta fold hydrolase n=1 Tax=Nocardioides sp. TF02-7 TaxID=2917724 RepID=UPI001F06C2F4|nr:alpha/beta hydrolase [Nocardioides sp. TF02-7]UMG93581.1 alpha/beta hydrolase [Nocardioides sp. TF02-7]